MRDAIAAASLALFDAAGYHKTSIRDITAQVGCSLPTLYYYFGSKERLFESVVCEAYERLNEQISDQIPEGLAASDTLYYTILQKKMLPEEDKRVFRLAFRVLLGIEGTAQTRERLARWEKEHEAVHPNPVAARIALRVTDNILQRVILLNDPISDEEIREELSFLYDGVHV